MRIIPMKTINNLDRALDDLGQIIERDFSKVLEDLIAAMGPLLGADDLVLGHDLQNARGRVKRRMVNIANLLGRSQLAR